ncbi:MAG: hypothetical protein HYV63_15075 [Candidatus Schekmanbacteria bacterium]|nr:hypothetical protein [Candidatus Schekmanbacteria bacterium]
MIREAKEILDRLPELLRTTPELRYRLYEVIAEEFPPRREMERVLSELAAMREESNRQFAAMSQRFEAVDRRFEAVDRRFEAVDRRFEAIQAELVAQREESARRFETIDRRFEAMDQRMGDIVHHVNITVGGLQRRAGRNLEDTVAGMLRIALGRTDLLAEHVRLRQKVEDQAGLIGPAGRRYEYDILAINGRTCVFEVKSAPDEEDVDRFRDKCDLVERELGRGPIERILVTLGKTEELARYCAANGIVLV